MKIVIVNQEKEETVSSITYVVDLFNRLFNSGTSKYARRLSIDLKILVIHAKQT